MPGASWPADRTPLPPGGARLRGALAPLRPLWSEGRAQALSLLPTRRQRHVIRPSCLGISRSRLAPPRAAAAALVGCPCYSTVPPSLRDLSASPGSELPRALDH